MKRVFLFLFFVILCMSLPEKIVFAVQSKSLDTIVGNPPAVANSDLTKAAADLIEAFRCSNNIAFPKTPCVREILAQKGYQESVLKGFDIRGSGVGSCAQCLGYVSLSLTLLSGDGETLSAGRDYVSAAIVYNQNEFRSGDLVYKKLDNKEIQTGDVGVAISGEGIGSNGHILIVKSPAGNIKFTAYESSFGGLICSVRDDYPHNKDIYVFFRKAE